MPQCSESVLTDAPVGHLPNPVVNLLRGGGGGGVHKSVHPVGLLLSLTPDHFTVCTK